MENETIPVALLIQKALEMMHFSYAPYSHFHVGAALFTKDGQIFTGCNIENAAFGPSNCAERTALFKAVSEGKKEFSAIAITGGPNGTVKTYCPPCGVCRQVLAEFCDKDFKIIMAVSAADFKIRTLGEILPESFSL